MRPEGADDVVGHVEDTLVEAERAAAAAYDRVAASRELRAVLFDFAGRRGTPQLTLSTLFEIPESIEEDARLRSLIERAYPTPTEGDT